MKEMKKSEAFIGLLMVGVLFYFMAREELTNAPGPDRTSNRSKQSKQYFPTPEIGTIERLEYEIKRKIGDSNRNKTKIQIEKTSTRYNNENLIKITLAIDDNITNGFIKSGARDDIIDILRATKNSKYDYSEITIFGTFPLTDKYGNSEEETVIKISFTPDIVNRINWRNFLSDNLYDVADSVWLHPVFR